jgi:large repetitive protein
LCFTFTNFTKKDLIMTRNIHAFICLLFLTGLSAGVFAQSQHCSLASGPGVCSPDQNLTTPGFFPNYDSLPCALDGVPYDTVIQFHVPPSAAGYNVSSITIVNIVNIPCGLCWTSNSTNNSFGGNQTGCIRVEGTTYDAPNQYLLKVYANVTVSVPVIGNVTENDLNIDTVAGLKYYARVAVPGGPCLPVDTNANIHYAENGQGTLAAPTISGNSSFCSGGTAVLNATNSAYYGYVWSNGAVTPSISVSAAGTYTVTVFGNCASATASKTISALTSPSDSISPGNAAVCNGSSVTLTASGGGTYLWSTGSTSPSITVAPSSATSYTVTVTAANGCTATATRNVSIGSLPTVSITPASLNICGGYDTSLAASATPGVTYAWSTGSTSDTAQIAPTANTTYKVTVTNSSNCSATASRQVSVIAVNKTITANGPTTLCGGGSVTLSAPAGNTTYLWSDNETTQSITVSSAGTFTCTVTNSSGCTGVSNTITVTVANNLNPVITASNGLNICPGGNTVLSVGAGYGTYSWSLGATSDSIIATPTSNHTYSVTVTQGACVGSASVTVNVGNFPVGVSITPAGPIHVCNGSSVTLSIDSSYAGYHWNTGSLTDSIQVNSTGNYIVTVTQNNACSGTASAQVTFTNPPSPVITPSGTQNICNGNSVNLNAGNGYLSYLWSTGDTTQIINVIAAGSYTVTVGEVGCTGSSANPVVVAITPTPNPGITPAGPTSLCAGQTVTLTADAGYDSYLWSNGNTSSSITVDTTGNYSVTVTTNGCSGASSQPAAVFVNAIPVATAAQVGTASGFAELQAGPANATYQWLVQQTQGGAYTATSATAAFDTVVCSTVAAYYSVVATQNNCSDTSAGVEVICTGLSDISSLLSFTIQPNPAKDVLYVNYELNAATTVHLSVIDMTGQKVADIVNSNEPAGLQKHQVLVGSLAPGIYLLNFMTDSGSFNTRFMKQ